MRYWSLACLVAIVSAVMAYAAIVAVRARSGRAGELNVFPAELEYTEGVDAGGELRVTLSNSGGGPIRLEAVTTGCGCTTAILPEKRLLLPGEQDVMFVNVQPPSFGTKETYIALETDGPPAPRIPVHLHGRQLTPPYVRQAPAELRHEFALRGNTLEMEFEVSCIELPTTPNWLIGFTERSGMVTVHGPFDITTAALSEEAIRRTYRFQLEWNRSDAAPEPLTSTLIPQTASAPLRPLQNIPICLTTCPALRAIPTTLVFHSRTGDVPKTRRRVIIRSATDDEWQISDIRTRAEWLTAVVAHAGDATKGMQAIDVVLDPKIRDQESTTATIEVWTTHPHCPLVSISVRAMQIAGDTPTTVEAH